MNRAKFLLSFFLLLFLLVAARLFYIQIHLHEKYLSLAKSQHEVVRPLSPERGKLFFRDGSPLVLNEERFLLFAEPQRIENPKEVAGKLKKNLSEDRILENLLHRLQSEGDYVPLAKGLTLEEKEKIESLEIGGLGFERKLVRFYPEGGLVAHVLGFLGEDKEGSPQGYYGVEGFYDGDLSGRGGRIFEERGAKGEPILAGRYYHLSPRLGVDLYLTLDRTIQFMVEERLKQGVKKYGAQGGTALLLDSQTGALLALASVPSFDPANRKDEEEDIWRNPAISESYEPGSSLKPLTIAAALEEGKITPETTFESGPIKIGKYWIRTYNDKYYGEETMTEVLMHSDNTGAAWVALEKLGSKTLRDYFLRFGLGEETGIDLEGEEEGKVKELRDWGEIDLANASFGQGVAVTPLQLARAFAVFANGGILPRPFVVAGMRQGGKKTEFEPYEGSRVISKETAETVRKMLTKAAEEGLTKWCVPSHFHVAGKTGTGQIPAPGGYEPRATNTTFVGFLPSHPSFVLLVRLERPSSSIYGASTAAPLWMQVAEDLVKYLGLKPDK